MKDTYLFLGVCCEIWFIGVQLLLPVHMMISDDVFYPAMAAAVLGVVFFWLAAESNEVRDGNQEN